MQSFSQLALTCIKKPLLEVIHGFNNKTMYNSCIKWNISILPLTNIVHFFSQQQGISNIKFILYEPIISPNTTIFYTNSMDGLIGIIEKRAVLLNWEIFYLSIHNNDGEYYNSFHFYRIFGNLKRKILCYQDPHWTFYQQGEPLSFEDIERYSLKPIKKRLDYSLIIQYFKHNNWDIENDSFWKPKGCVYLFEQIY